MFAHLRDLTSRPEDLRRADTQTPTRHSVFSTHSDTQAVPAFHGIRMFITKILVSVQFVSAILGPEMAAPILWTPRISAFFLQENLHVHKIPRLGGVFWFGGGGGECRLYFYGRGDFSELFLLSKMCCGLRGVTCVTCLENHNLLKLRSLDSSCPFFLSDNSIRGR